jgi:hypothetical protein
MRCPSCGTEVETGATRCPQCGAELPEAEPVGHNEAEWVDLVTVLQTADPSLLMVAKSLLDAEHVPAFAEGTELPEGVSAGRIPDADIPMGPGRLRVHPEDAERAYELLSNLQPLPEGEEPAV